MNRSTYRIIWSLCTGLFLSFLIAPAASAAGVSISGTYEIIQKTDAGPLVKVEVRFHLVNQQPNAMTLLGVLLSDFGYPSAKDTLAVPVILPPGASQDVTQEFVIPHAQYDQWRRGLKPKVILTLKTATGIKTNEALRLSRVSAGKAE